MISMENFELEYLHILAYLGQFLKSLIFSQQIWSYLWFLKHKIFAHKKSKIFENYLTFWKKIYKFLDFIVA